LYRQYGGPIAVALELSKGPIVSALQKYDFFVIFPIDPTTLANHRKTFTLSGAKDDYQAAVRALAFKWIRILYRCWVTRTPYDEAKYLKTLQERGSPLLKMAESA